MTDDDVPTYFTNPHTLVGSMQRIATPPLPDDTPDERPWKRLRRTAYHRSRYGEVPVERDSLEGAENEWIANNSLRHRDVWRRVWRECDFSTLAAVALVCRRWRATLVESYNDVDMWGGRTDLSGAWLVAVLPLLARFENNPTNDALIWPYRTLGPLMPQLSKDRVWMMSARYALSTLFALPSATRKSAKLTAQLRHPTAFSVISTAAVQWSTPATMRAALTERNRFSVERRAKALTRQRNVAQLKRYIEGTLLARVSRRDNVDAFIATQLRNYVTRGPDSIDESILRYALARPAVSDAYRRAERYLRMRVCNQLVSQHRRTLFRDEAAWQRATIECPIIDVYHSLFDHLFYRTTPDLTPERVRAAILRARAPPPSLATPPPADRRQ